MQAVLIHPMDLARMIQHSSFDEVTIHKTDVRPVDDLVEINGRLFYQTTRVPETGSSDLEKI